MTLYNCKIYENEIAVRDFIPCKNPSGNIGLYDVISGEFYGNAGHMAATDHHLFSLDISDPLAFTKAHCETELNSAEHAIDLLKSLAINAER